MIYRPNALQTTERLREIPQGDAQDFPYIAIESDLEGYANRCASWHWHDYFEFVLVSGGDMELSIHNQTLRIAAGEGYFVNSNVMHMCRVAHGSDRCRLLVHQFDRSLIASSSAAARRYVQPVEESARAGMVHFRPENESHREILQILHTAFSCAEAEPAGYEMTIAMHMMQVWLLLWRDVRPELTSGTSFTSAEADRIKQMLARIHTDYAENLDVPSIAAAAGVCTRECYRSFRQVLGTTPTLYLMNHRVNTAARLLMETGRSITDIAGACGFSSPSYFCKVFRDIMGIPPREFRRREK